MFWRKKNDIAPPCPWASNSSFSRELVQKTRQWVAAVPCDNCKSSGLFRFLDTWEDGSPRLRVSFLAEVTLHHLAPSYASSASALARFQMDPDFSCPKSFLALQLTPHLSCLHPFSHTLGLACLFHSHTPSFWATYWTACLLQEAWWLGSRSLSNLWSCAFLYWTFIPHAPHS